MITETGDDICKDKRGLTEDLHISELKGPELRKSKNLGRLMKGGIRRYNVDEMGIFHL